MGRICKNFHCAKIIIRLPDSDGYRRACTLFNSRLKPRPAAVKPCRTEDDVIAGIQWVRENKKTISIKSGGHCLEGYCMADDSLSLDLSDTNAMSSIQRRKFSPSSPGRNCNRLITFC